MTALAAVAAQFQPGAASTVPTAKYVASPGPYSGSNGQNGNGLSFYVEPGGSLLTNYADSATSLSCLPSGSAGDRLVVLQIPLRPNGTFSSTTTQTAIWDLGARATITYIVVGRFQPASTTAQATATGTWRENVRLSSGNETSCTSGNVPWTATLNRAPARPKKFVRAGSYIGPNGQNGNGITFTVGQGGTSMQDVTDTATGLSCIPSGSFGDKLIVQQIPVKPSGAFNSITHQTNIVSGTTANITYTVSGYFEGQTTNSSSFVAGTWREDVTFSSGNTTSCSSGTVYWSASIR